MINTSLFILSVSLFTAMEAEEFIQKVEDYSKKINSFKCTIVRNTTRVPIFDTMEEAIKYETNRVKTIHGFSDKKLAEEKIYNRIRNNARIYFEGEKGYPVYYYCKCLNMDSFIVSIIDSKKNQCMQIIYTDNQFHVDYRPGKGSIKITNKKEHSRDVILPLYYERLYNIDSKDASLKKNDKGNLILKILNQNAGIIYKYIFDNEFSFIPSKIIKKTDYTESIFHNLEFMTITKNLIFPSVCLRTNTTYDSQTGNITKKYKSKGVIEDFEIIDDMNKNDLDIKIPLNTKVSDRTENNLFYVSSTEFGDMPTLHAILKNKDRMK